MDLDRLALILAIAFGILWVVGMTLGALIAGPLGWLMTLPLAIVVYLLIAVIRQRLGSREDDHYDAIEK